jgi:hypothetical protein
MSADVEMVRVVAIRRTAVPMITGDLIEVPAIVARPCAITPDGRIIIRMAWPNEYRLPLGSAVDIGFEVSA